MEVRNDALVKLAPDEPCKLHLGCGKRNIPGFIHIDLLPQRHLDYQADVRNLDFVPENRVDLVYACHVLEHCGRTEIQDVLREWRRVLKPGGLLRLSVPDFAACASLYYEQGLADGLSGLVGLIVGGQRDKYDIHKMIFDSELLTKNLHQAGFNTVQPWDWRQTEHAGVDDYSQAYLPHMDKENGKLMSLNLEAIK